MGARSRGAIASCALVAAAWVAARGQDDGTRAARSLDDAPPNVEAFEQTWRTIRDQFYDGRFHGVDWDGARERFLPRAKEAKTRRELHEVTIAMLGELKTSHTAIVEGDVFKEHFDNETKGLLAPTIGIEFVKLERGYFASDVIAGSPADAAGVVRGDRLLHVDGVIPEDAGLRPNAWDSGLGGPRSYYLPAGTRSTLVELERRPVATKPGYNIYQARIAPRPWSATEGARASATVTERGPGLKLGYVRLYHLLSEDVVDVLASLLTTGKLSETDGLVLDLRGRGGLTPCAEQVLAIFDRNARGGPLYGRPVVAVIDRETRSAKEILAWQLRDLRLATLVGERTRGAVLGARFVPLPDGAWLLLANYDVRALTAGMNLEGRGVEPDIQQRDDLPYAEGRDPLVARSRDVLVEKLLLARRTGRHGWY